MTAKRATLFKATLWILAVLAAFCVQLAGTTAVSREVRRPNVIIFLTDDLGTIDVNCFGSDDLITPNMNRIAHQGVRFTQAYAHTVCCPARAGLMTGRHAQRSNLNHWAQSLPQKSLGRNLPLDEWTLAEAFHEAGYETILLGKWHLGGDPRHTPQHHGFQHFFGILGGFVDNYRHYSLHGRGAHDLFEGQQELWREGEYLPDMLIKRGEDFIEHKRSKSFLMVFSVNLPHYPEQPTGACSDTYHNLEDPRRSYARVVSTCDVYLGRLLDQLDKHQLTDDTIVLMTSDNGHSTETHCIQVDDHRSGLPRGHVYGAHGGGGNTGPWRGAKGSFLEGGIRVPAILSYPAALPRGEVRHQAVTIMDWFPTLLELCGVASPPGHQFDGKSTVSIIESAEAQSLHPILYWQWGRGWAVREGPWKLIRGGIDQLQGARLPDPMLTNLDEFPPESTNFAPDRPDLVERLQARYEGWAADVFSRYAP